MTTIYICPDCRCEHDAPAEADYRLEARCFDCVHIAAVTQLRAAGTAVSPPRSRRNAKLRRSRDRLTGRGRTAA